LAKVIKHMNAIATVAKTSSSRQGRDLICSTSVRFGSASFDEIIKT
jgi:hypothetical protein